MIGRSLAPLNSSRTLRAVRRAERVRRSDDNSRRKVQNVRADSSALLHAACFRHSFATALAPLIGGDAKTGAKIMGHSAQTFMRYVRANDETARSAVERMAQGLHPAKNHVAASVLHVVAERGQT
jgi:integrase